MQIEQRWAGVSGWVVCCVRARLDTVENTNVINFELALEDITQIERRWAVWWRLGGGQWYGVATREKSGRNCLGTWQDDRGIRERGGARSGVGVLWANGWGRVLQRRTGYRPMTC